MILAKMALLFTLGSSNAYEGNEPPSDYIPAVEENFDEDAPSSPTFVPANQTGLSASSINEAINNKSGVRPTTTMEYMPDSPEADENGYVSHEDPIQEAIDNEMGE